jgi:hypothetical protein
MYAEVSNSLFNHKCRMHLCHPRAVFHGGAVPEFEHRKESRFFTLARRRRGRRRYQWLFPLFGMVLRRKG